MPEDSRAFHKICSSMEDEMSYRRRIIAAGLGIPEEILRDPEEKSAKIIDQVSIFKK